MVTEFVAVASAVISAGFIGSHWVLIAEFRRSRKEMAERVHQFDEITRRASDSNMSHASKILEIDDRIAGLNERLNMLQAGTSKKPWGVK